MLDHDHGDPDRRSNARDDLKDGCGRGRVKVGGGLVEDEHLGLEREDRGNGDLLLFSARERAELPIDQVRGSDRVQRPIYAPPDLGDGLTAIFQTKGDLIPHRRRTELRLGVLLDQAHDIGKLIDRGAPRVHVGDAHAALCSSIVLLEEVASDGQRQGRLSAAGGPCHDDKLAGHNL